MIELRVIFRGTVQGVGFRATTKRKADELGLKGFVRNLSDGSVELVAQGKKEAFKTLLQFLHQQFKVDEISENTTSPSKIYAEFTLL